MKVSRRSEGATRLLASVVGKLVSWVCTGVALVTAFFFVTNRLSWVNFDNHLAATHASIDSFVLRADEFWSAAHRYADIDGYLLIEVDGRTVLSKGYGKVGYGKIGNDFQIPLQESTTFHIGSLSKQFTAAIVLKLEEEGRLSTEWKVCRVLSHYCQGKLVDITIRQLLSHTSGLGAIPLSLKGVVTAYENMWRAAEIERYVNLQSPTWLQAEPGQKFIYSNFGYDTLSLIVERVTAEPFAIAMTKHLQNGGLDRTWVADNRPDRRLPDAKGSINFHLPFTKRSLKVPLDPLGLDHAGAFGAGAVVSSPGDLAHWGATLLNGRDLNEASRQKLWTPVQSEYAAGWVVRRNQTTDKMLYWHNGRVPGYSSSMALYPEQKMVVVWLSNTYPTNKDERQIFTDFDQFLFGRDYRLPTSRRTFPLPSF